MESVLNNTDCDRPLVEDVVGSSTGIRDTNMMMYLALLEQKAAELLAMQAFINSKVQKRLSIMALCWDTILDLSLGSKKHTAAD